MIGQTTKQTNRDNKFIYIYSGFRCPDGGNYGWVTVPEFPFGKICQLRGLIV